MASQGIANGNQWTERNGFMKITGMILLLVVVAAIIALFFGLRRSRAEHRQFDERQLALRAEGYRKGFFTTLAAGAAALFLVEAEIVPLACATLMMYLALIAGIVTFAVFCIVKDVFFHIGEKGTYYMVVCGVIVLADGAAAVSEIVNGTILENGVPTFMSCSSLVLALVFLVILIALLVRKFAGERDE